MALVLVTSLLVIGNATLMGSYFSIYLTDLGGTVQVVGTAAVLAALSEVPVMVGGLAHCALFKSNHLGGRGRDVLSPLGPLQPTTGPILGRLGANAPWGVVWAVSDGLGNAGA